MYFEQFKNERGLSKETIKGYKSTIKKYTEYYNMTLDELLEEAMNEETEIQDKRKRSIKTRLLQFRTHLTTETNLRTSTIRSHIKNLSTLYNHFDIELPNLPPLKDTTAIQTNYFDLPTKEQIKMAIETTGIRLASLILFMASSGTGRTECANLTIKEFIEACSRYYTSETLPEILEELYACTEPIVPTFFILRQKTNKPYYTFCTPEATEAIIEWLLLKLQIAEQNDEEVKLEDTVWGLTTRQITYHFNIINDELDFGYKGAYRFFRPHTLRKFHASNIGLSEENIDLLQGRSRDVVHEAYIKTNPEWLRKTYMNVMENVTIGNIGKKEIVHEEFTININIMLMGTDYGINL